jgi:hypothetical protein
MTNAHHTLEVEITVEYHIFGLVDDDGPVPGGPNWLTVAGSELVVTGPNCVRLRSGGTDHYAKVRLESWSSPPPYDTGQWEDMWRGELLLSSGAVRLTSVTASAPNQVLRVGRPGIYLLDVHVRGRAAVAASVPLPVFPHDIERWLLRFWPAQAEQT